MSLVHFLFQGYQMVVWKSEDMTCHCHAGQVSINNGCGGSGHFITTYSYINASCSSCTSKVSVTLSLCTKGCGTLLSNSFKNDRMGKGGGEIVWNTMRCLWPQRIWLYSLGAEKVWFCHGVSGQAAWQAVIAYDACVRLCLRAWSRGCEEAPKFLVDECCLLRDCFGYVVMYFCQTGIWPIFYYLLIPMWCFGRYFLIY